MKSSDSNNAIPKDGPSGTTKNCIDVIIQETRMNTLVWHKVSNDLLSASRAYTEGTAKKPIYIELQRAPDSQTIDTRVRYTLQIGNLKITDKYTPVEVLGQYLFCDDYKKDYHQ